MAAFQQLHHLVEQPRRRHVLEQRGQRADGLERGRVDLEIQLGSKAHGAQHPYRILAVAGGGIADHAQQPCRQIIHPAHRIDQRLGDRIVIEGVDGEIASVGVFFAGTKHVVVQHPPMGVGLAVGMGCPEGGDLDGLAPEHDVNDAKAPADDARPPEKRLHRLGGGVGGHVEVLRGTAQQQVAHAAPHDVGAVAGMLQLFAGTQRSAGDLLAGKSQRLGGENAGFGQLGGWGAGAARCAAWNAGAGTGRCARRGRRVTLGRAAGDPFEQSVEHDTYARGNRSMIGQPRWVAVWRSTGSGLVATGCVAISSIGRSLRESE